MNLRVTKRTVSPDAVDPEYLKEKYARDGWYQACIEGPWYSDDDIYGEGHTEEEAKKEALDKLHELYTACRDFLIQNGRAV